MAENERPDPRRPGPQQPPGWHGPAPSLPQYGPPYGERPPPPLRGQQPPPPPPPPLPDRRPPAPQGPPQQRPHQQQTQWQSSGPPPAPQPAQPRGDQPSGGQPTGGQPTGDQPPTRTPRLVGALAMAVAAVVATVFTVTWIWNRAEALSPVDLPSANGTPLETVDPSVKPTSTPPPKGKYVDGNMVAWNNDRMPGMPVPTWKDQFDPTGLNGGIAMWMIVHEDYNGSKDWGNLVAFGGLGKGIPYNSTPAGMKLASQRVAARLVANLYDDRTVPIKGSVKHRTLTVDGHRAHELVARIPIKEPKLNETNSVISIVVIDRGDGTATVGIGDFAGTTTGWFLYWRNQVQKIQINR